MAGETRGRSDLKAVLPVVTVSIKDYIQVMGPLWKVPISSGLTRALTRWQHHEKRKARQGTPAVTMATGTLSHTFK